MFAVEENEPAGSRWLKALVYGKSGTGKTNFGVSAPDPLILLSERQGVPHIRAAAKRLGKPLPSVLVIESVDDYRNVLRALQGDRSKPFVVKHGDKVVFTRPTFPASVVLDSLTEAMELVVKEIRDQSPQRTGKDGLPVDSERFWNVLSDRAAKLVRSFRDCEANVLFLCLLDDRMIGEGETATQWTGPSLPMRKLPEIVMAAVNVVGVTYRAKKLESYEWGIRTMGPDTVQLKPFPPLQKNEVTDFTSWCKRINGDDDGQRVSGPDDEATAPTAPTAPTKPADVVKPIAPIVDPEKPAEQKPTVEEKTEKKSTKNAKAADTAEKVES